MTWVGSIEGICEFVDQHVGVARAEFSARSCLSTETSGSSRAARPDAAIELLRDSTPEMQVQIPRGACQHPCRTGKRNKQSRFTHRRCHQHHLARMPPALQLRVPLAGLGQREGPVHHSAHPALFDPRPGHALHFGRQSRLSRRRCAAAGWSRSARRASASAPAPGLPKCRRPGRRCHLYQVQGRGRAGAALDGDGMHHGVSPHIGMTMMP